MEDNKIIGAAKRVAGRVESAAGALTGDARAEVRGKVRALKGTVQQRYGEATETARDLVDSHSVVTLLAAGTLGLLLGVILSRR